MSTLAIRRARAADLPRLVALLADDVLGAARERAVDPLPAAYAEAFAAIDADPCHTLLVAEAGGAVVGMLQLTCLPGLAHEGAWRAQLEGVRVASDVRGRGIGERLVRAALELARERGCRIVQLTSDRARADAHRFYERLGFVASHVGMKLELG